MSDTVARVHYEIPDDLHRKAKAAAAMRGLTLRAFVIEALRQAVERMEALRQAVERTERDEADTDES
jgi:HicB family